MKYKITNVDGSEDTVEADNFTYLGHNSVQFYNNVVVQSDRNDSFGNRAYRDSQVSVAYYAEVKSVRVVA